MVLPKPTPLRLAGGLLTLYPAARWCLSIAADIADAPEGLSRISGWLRFPGPAAFDSGWFALVSAAAGIGMLAWPRIGATTAEEQDRERLSVAAQSISAALSSGWVLLGACDALALLRDPSVQQRQLAYYRKRTFSYISANFAAGLLRYDEKALGDLIRIVREGYKGLCLLDHAIDDMWRHGPLKLGEEVSPRLSQQYREDRRKVDHYVDAALGLGSRSHLDVEAIEERHI